MELRAVLFTPGRDGPEIDDMAICTEWCTRRGIDVAAVATAWDDVFRVIGTGEAQVVVVARHDQLPPDRTPRIEVVEDEYLHDDAPYRTEPGRAHHGLT